MRFLSRLLCGVLIGCFGVAFAADVDRSVIVVDVGYVPKAGGGCPKYARVMGPDGYCWPSVAVNWIDGRISEIKVSFEMVCAHEKTPQMSIAPTVFVCGTRDRICRRCA